MPRVACTNSLSSVHVIFTLAYRKVMLRGARATRRGTCVPVIVVIAAVWLFTFALSRAHMLLQAYTDLCEVRDDESWLLQQCKADEFYSKMKQHSALCDEVAHKARDVLVLKAMRHVIDNSFLCGYDPCVELLDRAVQWSMGRGLLFTTCVVAVVVFGPVLVLPMYRRQINALADDRVKRMYLENPQHTNMYAHLIE